MEQKKTNTKINVVSFNAVPEQDNPNLLKFSAVVGHVNRPSDGTPCGGIQGYKVILSDDGIDVDSLKGSGVDCVWANSWFADGSANLKGHDAQFKIGVINDAWIENGEIHASGHLWKRDFPDICDTIECAKDSLGCSVEASYTGIKRNDTDKTLTCSGVNFTGVAILYKSKAAFKNTSFMCSLMDENEENEELEKNEILSIVNDAVSAQFAEAQKAQDERLGKIEKALLALSEKPEAKEPKKPAENPQGFDFSELTKSIVEAVKTGIEASTKVETKEPEKVEGPKRKTGIDFSTVKNFDNDNEPKSYLELAEEVDKDDTLTESQKWAKKFELWGNYRKEN